MQATDLKELKNISDKQEDNFTAAVHYFTCKKNSCIVNRGPVKITIYRIGKIFWYI